MQYEVLEPIFDREERKFYAVGDVITLSKKRVQEISERLKKSDEKLEDYLLKVKAGDKNGPTGTTEDTDKGE